MPGLRRHRARTAGDSVFRWLRLAAIVVLIGIVLSDVMAEGVLLSWTDNSENEAGFDIERSANDGPFTLIGTVGSNVTQYVDHPPDLATTYAYRVLAYNATHVSSYSNLAFATTNLPPTISSIGDRSINPNTDTGSLPFVVQDDFTAAEALLVSAISSNPDLVPVNAILLGGSGSSRTVTVTPTANMTGLATITVSVSDGVFVADRTFRVTVGAPTVTAIPTQSIPVDGGPLQILFAIADNDTPSTNLTVLVETSDETLLPLSGLVLAGDGADRTLTLTPGAGQSGAATLTLVVSDGVLVTRQTVEVRVGMPVIAGPGAQIIDEDAVAGPLAFTVGDSETSADALVVEGSSSNLDLVPVENIQFAGSGVNRTVTVTPEPDAHGQATITIRVGDGSKWTSTTFLVTVQPMNDSPVVWVRGDLAIAVNESPVEIGCGVEDAESPSSSLTLTAESSNPALVPDGNISIEGTGKYRRVHLSPVPELHGTAYITLTVSDGVSEGSTTFVVTVGAPSISEVANLIVPVNGTSGPLAVSVWDRESASDGLVLTGSSANPALVPDANIVFAGTGENRTVTLTPAANQSGFAKITLTVDDGLMTTETSFYVVVGVPTISAIAPQVIQVNQVAGPINFVVGGGTAAPDTLVVTATSDNIDLVPDANITIAGAGALRTVTVTPLADSGGAASISLTVTTGEFEATTRFWVNVVPMPAAIVLSDLYAIFDGNPKPATATSNPAGLPVELTYDGEDDPPTGAGEYFVAALVDTVLYTGGQYGWLVIDKADQTIAFAPLADHTYGDGPFALQATALSGLPVSFEVVSGPASIAGDVVTLEGAGLVKIRAVQPGDENIAGAFVERTFTVKKAPADVALSGLAATYDGLPKAISATPSVGGVSVLVTYDGSSAPPTNSGIYMVEAVIDDPLFAGSASGVLTIAKASATVALGDTVQTYNGTPRGVSVVTTPAGLSVITTYGGSLNPPSVAGNYAVQAVVNEANFTGSASATLVIAKADQTIAIAALPGRTYGDAPFALVASASSGLPVTFEVVSGPASVAGGMVTLSGAGLVTIRAAQLGDSNFQGASVERTFVVQKASASVVLSGLTAVYDGLPKAVTATPGVGGVSVVVTYDGSQVPPTNSGSYVVEAVIEDANVTGAATGTLTVAKAGQVISFGPLVDRAYGDAPFDLAASASSGLPVTFELVSGPASLVGATLTVGEVGLVTVRAVQPGDTNFNAASIERTFAVKKVTASIALSGLSATYDSLPKAVVATPSVAGVSVVVTYAGNSAAPTNSGSYLVEAVIDDPHVTGSANGTLTIAKAAATVVVEETLQTYNGLPRSVRVRTTPAGLNVVTTYDGSLSPPSHTGTYAVQAIVNNANFAGSASTTLIVSPGDFAGAYFGTFGPNGGNWAMWIYLDGSGTFVGDNSRVLVGSLEVDSSGAIVIAGTSYARETSTASNGPSATSPSATASAFTLTGRIIAGDVMGAIAGSSETLTGRLDPAAGPAAGYSGLFQASELFASDGTAYAVVGPSGRVVLATVSAGVTDGAAAYIDDAGRASLTSTAGHDVTVAVNSVQRTFVETVIPSVEAARTFVGVEQRVARTDHLFNISTRSHVGTGSQVPIAGFVIDGTAPKTVLIRAVGPGLTPYLPPGERDLVLTDPTINLYRHEGTADVLVASNNDWAEAPNGPAAIVAAEAEVHAFSLPAGSRDAVLLVQLAPGAYTAVVSGQGGLSGLALVEMYEIPTGTFPGPRLINISTRGQIDANAGIMIAGFVVEGNAPKRVLIRGIGPGLANYLLPSERPLTLADPRLDLFDDAGSILRSNDDWGAAGDTDALVNAAAAVGAFPITAGSKDAVLFLTLPPGAYTVHLSGVNAGTGIGIVEVYDVP